MINENIADMDRDGFVSCCLKIQINIKEGEFKSLKFFFPCGKAVPCFLSWSDGSWLLELEGCDVIAGCFCLHGSLTNTAMLLGKTPKLNRADSSEYFLFGAQVRGCVWPSCVKVDARGNSIAAEIDQFMHEWSHAPWPPCAWKTC